MRSADVLRLEADVAVQLENPDKPDLKRLKIGRLHVMPFVSPSYVEIYGMPKSADDIRQNHRVVIQDAEQTKGKEMYDKYAGREQLGFVAMRNNVSTAHLWSIAKGAGIGWLPTYVPALGDPLIPLDIGVQVRSRYLAGLSSGREEDTAGQAADRMDRPILRRTQISVVQR